MPPGAFICRRVMQDFTTGVQWEVFLWGLDTQDDRFLSLSLDAVSETRDSCLASVEIKGVFWASSRVAWVEQWVPNGHMGPLPPPYDYLPEPCGLYLHSRSQCSL